MVKGKPFKDSLVIDKYEMPYMFSNPFLSF